MKYNINKIVNIAKVMQVELSEKIKPNSSNCAYYNVQICIDEFLDNDGIMSHDVFDLKNKTLFINLLKLIDILDYDQISQGIKDIMNYVTSDTLNDYSIIRINKMLIDYLDYKYSK